MIEIRDQISSSSGFTVRLIYFEQRESLNWVNNVDDFNAKWMRKKEQMTQIARLRWNFIAERRNVYVLSWMNAIVSSVNLTQYDEKQRRQFI